MTWHSISSLTTGTQVRTATARSPRSSHGQPRVSIAMPTRMSAIPVAIQATVRTGTGTRRSGTNAAAATGV